MLCDDGLCLPSLHCMVYDLDRMTINIYEWMKDWMASEVDDGNYMCNPKLIWNNFVKFRKLISGIN